VRPNPANPTTAGFPIGGEELAMILLLHTIFNVGKTSRLFDNIHNIANSVPLIENV
jgi:hypothetical protein